MTHDPLCPPMNKHHIYCPVWDFDNECDDCCRCDLIAQVLSDEQKGIIGSVELAAIGQANQQAYREGQRDMLAKCITAVEEIIPDDSDNGSWEATIAAAWLRHAVSRIRQEKP